MSFQDLRYEIITEDGTQKLTLQEYHTKPELMAKIGLVTTPPEGRKTVFMGGTIISFPYSILDKDLKKRSIITECENIVLENPLKFFVPQTESVQMFLNDREHNCKGFVAGNGAGKTTMGCIDVLLDIVPCDPTWPIFTYSGINYRQYRGPLKNGGVGVISYEWSNHQSTIWPQVVRRWTPKFALGDWADGGKGTINWKNCPSVEIAGTPFNFFACSQAQTVFEAAAMDIYWWDEQGEEEKFNGANARVRRRNGRHIFTLTPHRVSGRPDTGAGSWIHKLHSGEVSAGLKVKFYHSDIFGIPDWIFSEQAKKDAYKEWVTEPTANNDIKKLREGRSRLYGDFHQTSGLVFDEWTENIHLIEPFDIPKNWTKYRSIDHGRVNPTACLWAAVSPEGDVYVYREYYKRDRTITENVKGIIEASGNTRQIFEKYVDDSGRVRERFNEKPKKERFRKTVLDSRSMGKKADESNLTVGQMYRDAGIVVQPADGQTTDKQLAVAKEYFTIDWEKKHPITGELGASRIFFFSTLVNFKKELMSYVNEEVTRTDRSGNKSVSERPRQKDDHLMTAMLYLLMERLSYFQDQYDDDDDDDDFKIDKTEQDVVRDPYCGY